MEVDASRTAASSVLNTYPHRTFQAYHSSSPSLCTAPAPMSPGTYPGSNNDLADRSYMARPDEPRATASSDRAHASSSRNYWPRFSPPSTAHHPTRSETWPPSRTHPSASPAGPLRLPSLTTIIPSVDAHRSGSEIQRSPTASFSSSQSLPASLPPIASLGGGGGSSGSSSTALPRLPPILQVEKQQVTTSATQAASASRRRNEAHFVCPVPGCGSTFTRRFNLRGHLRSHTAERPFMCEWPGCNKGFARQHDCKRHQALHTAKSQANVCQGCGKTFSRLDALNRHLRSENGAECRQMTESLASSSRLTPDDDWETRSTSTVRSGRRSP